MNASSEIVKLKYDTVFKMFFCSKANTKSVKSFLARVLEIPVESIKEIIIRNPELLPEETDEKFSRIDINMIVDNRVINVEIQLKREADFASRALFHWSKLYAGELKAGEEYGSLKETVCINIINFNMFDCPEFHSHFQVMEKKRHEVLSEKFAIHFFELRKLGKNIDKSNPLMLWMQLINAETKEELDMLKQTNVQEISEAVMILEEMSADEKMREISRLREKRMHDEASLLSTARNEGITIGKEEGIAIGEKRAASQFIAKLRKSGMTEEQIQNILNQE